MLILCISVYLFIAVKSPDSLKSEKLYRTVISMLVLFIMELLLQIILAINLLVFWGNIKEFLTSSNKKSVGDFIYIISLCIDLLLCALYAWQIDLSRKLLKCVTIISKNDQEVTSRNTPGNAETIKLEDSQFENEIKSPKENSYNIKFNFDERFMGKETNLSSNKPDSELEQNNTNKNDKDKDNFLGVKKDPDYFLETFLSKDLNKIQLGNINKDHEFLDYKEDKVENLEKGFLEIDLENKTSIVRSITNKKEVQKESNKLDENLNFEEIKSSENSFKADNLGTDSENEKEALDKSSDKEFGFVSKNKDKKNSSFEI